MIGEAPHVPGPGSEQAHAVIRELRIKVGLLQSELEDLRRAHAALEARIASDVASLARRYLEPATSDAPELRALGSASLAGDEGAQRRTVGDAADGARDHRRA